MTREGEAKMEAEVPGRAGDGVVVSAAGARTLLEEKTDKSAWWRAALGEYPTGVAIVTARNAAGDPVGMVVGSFSVVSEQPPFVSFMPAESSTSYPDVREARRFTVNVLGEAHRDLCRAFFSKSEDRFSAELWQLDAAVGPRLREAVVWFDAEIVQEHAAGDHLIVIGEVTEFGVGAGDAGLPLLFLRGGYGTFSAAGGTVTARDVGLSVRQADAFRQTVLTAAQNLQVQCGLVTVIRDTVVVLAASSPQQASTPLVGMSFPFAAPLAPALAAWAPPEQVRLWEEGARHLLGVVDRQHLAAMLTQVREFGYAITPGHDPAQRFDEVVSADGARLSDLARLWNQIDEQTRAAEQELRTAYSLQIPIFDADGHARFELYLGPLQQPLSDAESARIMREARALVDQLTADLGGAVPEGYPASF